MDTKYIFITGGVCSSLGKGITAASIGMLLEKRGLRIAMLKLDPYLNVDPGTMNPFQHGEVYVTDDGAEQEKRDTIEDFAYTARFAKECGAKLIEANYSCPNVATKEGSLFSVNKCSCLFCKSYCCLSYGIAADATAHAVFSKGWLSLPV